MKKYTLLAWVLWLLGVEAALAQCTPISLPPENPWIEDFESYPHNSAVPLDDCWATPEQKIVDNGTSPFVYTGYPSACHSGSNSLELKQSPVMAVLPEFAHDINTLSISFWGNTSAHNATAAGTLVLGVITDVTNPASFIPVDTIPATAFQRQGQDAPYTNFMGVHYFSNVTPEPGMRIALRLTGTMRSWNLDDITVTRIHQYDTDTLPFTASFDSAGSWRMNNGDAANHWAIGLPSGNGSPALFITHDNSTPGYDIAVASTVMAEKRLVMPESDTVRVDFDVWAGGESHFDFLKVFLAPDSVTFDAGRYNNTQSQSQYAEHALDFTAYKPQSTGSEGYPYLFNLTGDTVHVTAAMANPAPGGIAKLVFLWRNDNTTGTQPGAVLRNVTVVEGPPCTTPSGLHVTSQSNSHVTIEWDSLADAGTWNYRYGPVDATDIVTGSTSSNSFTIQSDGGTLYWFSVQADCGNSNISNWSDTLHAFVTNVGVGNGLENRVVLFPNPAKEVVNVQCPMYKVQSVEVFDVYGKVVRTVAGVNNDSPAQTRINVSGLADGMYFVRVATEMGAVTKSFLKK